MLISVIDSGFNTKYYKCKNKFIISGESKSDDLHGTACVKTIDANIENGTIISIDAYNNFKKIDDISISNAIYKAISLNSKIISISLGYYSFSYSLVKAISVCEEHGIIILAANDHLNRIVYPACLKNVFTVDSYKGKEIVFDNGFYVPNLITYIVKNKRKTISFSGSSIACAYMAANINNILTKFNPSNQVEFIKEHYYSGGKLNV